jgi:hypothetical protein
MKDLAESDVFNLDNKDTDELKAFTLRYRWDLPAACRAGNDVGGELLGGGPVPAFPERAE